MTDLTPVQYKEQLETFELFCNKTVESIDKAIDEAKNSNDDAKTQELLKRKEGYTNFIDYVMNKTNFLQAPASTRFHLAIPHGLLVHTNSVTRTCLKLHKALNTGIPDYMIILVAQAHDVGKHNQYKENPPTEKQKQYGYKNNYPYLFDDSQVYNEHESRSLFILSRFMNITEEEWVAIMYHNSPWDGVTKNAFKQNKLMTILSMADYYSTLYLEERN